ncbi:Dehydroquinate synthase-like protein [Choiromyces venosus 120613-1]|uniref:hydroxyacid-oxoacid transhydrogenase n=1 Tax=Choiromyces venosus 120613-1 TaxID=1336337 RepID=A0A3N4IXK8_9PEZI|nr:Dehydroquinate synthase-like protein [Choiromyces venosus 120613-1]
MVFARIAPTARSKALSLLLTIQYTHPPTCPCHGSSNHSHHFAPTASSLLEGARSLATPVGPQKEYAFEMAASSIRFGPGSTREVGMDFANMKAKKVIVISDKTIEKLTPMRTAIEALESAGVKYEIFSDVMVEPKDYSVKKAIEFGKQAKGDAYLAVGGGSVMDTAKMVNLYTNFPEANFLDFVNAPLGKGLPITKALSPLICIPTTAGTGSETTGTAIFDLVDKKAKTGIAHRVLKPTLGICDPLNTRSMPSAVHASSGLDVLCHALESYTAIPYNERRPRPTNPILRPAYQGANPISDVFSFKALQMTVKYLPRAVCDPDDQEAQSQMLLAATLAGVGFGNAGVHLCHGMSYPISGGNKGYKHKGYQVDHPIIPHGVSVAVTAPAVFKFTAASNPERHLAAAEVFGVDVSNARAEDAGELLSNALKEFLHNLGDQPKGIKNLGYTSGDIQGLVEGTIPQHRVLMLAPNLDEDLERQKVELNRLFEDSLEF